MSGFPPHVAVRVDLVGTKIFVGGPIQHAMSANGFLEPLRQDLARIISALRERRGHVFSAHVMERFGADTSQYTSHQIAARDFTWMQHCNVFVPVLPVRGGQLLRTDGTYVELGWASALRKPIMLVTPLPLTDSATQLLRGLNTVADVRLFDLPTITADASALLTAIGMLEVRTQVNSPVTASG
ncbi:hypothetical protein SSP35_38_00210 [Streptomyces sp. NBRC 110611]|uniref:nucleoside 2-deoxyribosyltransferase n=1 Tax=Streptomyces sp. NBRC 110611 TaxID=1621259 RepID=UPI000856DCA6|nr:nucleoside 2-deoxyribosyltransferase [Streptomyces sp. NBRC 110611]GAU71425.1 hypothetical protein SSP35_38_00210 [Streptomyces sp. NBRC 110611]